MKVHKRTKLFFIFLKPHFSYVVSWNFRFLHPACQIYGRTSTVTQDKPLCAQKIFIYQVKQASYVSQLLASICISDLGKEPCFLPHIKRSAGGGLFIYLFGFFSSFKFWPTFFICLSSQLLMTSNGLCKTFTDSLLGAAGNRIMRSGSSYVLYTN